MTTRQETLLEYVKQMHGDQKRKYTGEEYWTHPLAVANRVGVHVKNTFEVAICHDLFEDTECNYGSLYEKLLAIGYNVQEATFICNGTNSLTDKYTKENFPYLNRSERTSLEADRLATETYLIQSIKYADMIENISSICEHDSSFAKIYVQEKEHLTSLMTNGNLILRGEVLAIISKFREDGKI